MKKNIIRIILSIIIIFLLTIGIVIYKNYDLLYNDIKVNDIKLIDDILENNTVINNEEVINTYIKEFNNNDVVGEIEFINTNYKRALMQYTDNDYYLNHTEDKTNSYMGSIYLDYRTNIDDSNKLLIYGHNSETIDMPFKILENYYDKDYYNDHKYIKITTKKKTRIFKIYALTIETSDYSYMKIDFNNKEDWLNHIRSYQNKSLYKIEEELNYDDKILILQTCSTHKNYKKYDKKYLIILAKEVK